MQLLKSKRLLVYFIGAKRTKIKLVIENNALAVSFLALRR